MNLQTVLASLVALCCSITPAAGGNVDLPRFPSISPDGGSVVFSWRGDLWRVSSAGGLATRLTSHPGDDLRSTWSPDGDWVAFESGRNGPKQIYLMRSNGTDLRQVTVLDRPAEVGAFGTDANGDPIITLHANMEGDVYRDYRPYGVGPDGGDVARLHDAFGSWPRVSPDGEHVVFARGGVYDGWERRGYIGPESSDVWLFSREDDAFTRLTTWAGNDGKAKWLDDDTLLYLSDRENGVVNLYRMDLDQGEANARAVTSFRDIDIHDYDVAANGRTVVLHRWDALYTVDLTRRNARPKRLEITANEDDRDNFELNPVDRDVSEAALSPDGKVMAVVAYGEVYVRHVDDDSPTRRVTDSHAREQDIAWSPDGLKLYFTSDREGSQSIYAATVNRTRSDVTETFTEATGESLDFFPKDTKDDKKKKADDEDENNGDADNGDADNGDADNGEDADDEDADESDEAETEDDPALDPTRWRDAMTFTIEPVVARDSHDREADPSPDGKHLAFRGVRGQLNIMDLETGAITPLLESWDMSLGWAWAPDSRHIAYAVQDMNFNADIFIAPIDGSAAPVNVTRHPDSDYSPVWSADGRVLYFLSERVNEETDVWRLHLDPRLDRLTDQERTAYYDAAVKAAKKRKPLDPKKKDDDDDEADAEATPAPFDLSDLDDAYLRVSRVTSFPGGEGNLALTPGGDRVIFSASGPLAGLHSQKYDGSDRKEIAGGGSVQHVSFDGGRLVYVRGGQARTVKPAGGDDKTIDIDHTMRIDLQQQASQKFLEAAAGLGENFYSPNMNGVDWDRVTEQYHELAKNTRTAEEFNWVGARFLGELNGSHLGIRSRGPGGPTNAEGVGRLGATYERVADGYRVTSVIERSPAESDPMALEVGDVITAIEFEPIAADDTLMERLKGRVGEETAVTVRRAGNDITLLLTPVSYNAVRQLAYNQWRRENARIVDELSNGRLGYIHIQGMNQGSLDVFERDLFAAANGKDGLVLDVRNNGGGWTTDRVLSSIMVEPHAYTIPRGADPDDTGHYPQDRLFIQRYPMPMNLLCNEKSYSNAEIISHAFKTLGRGTLVGQQTHGSVISTGGWTLIDGTFVRMPFRGWYVLDGTDMELNGAMPDLVVEQTPQAEVAGEDEQLKAAVEDLLRRLP